MRSLNLDTMERRRHTVTVGGVSYPIRAITPRVAGIIDSAPSLAPGEKVGAYYDAVALLIPTMPRELVDDIEPEDAMAIIQLAGTEVREVDEAASDPNARGSAPSEPTTEPDLTATPLVAC